MQNIQAVVLAAGKSSRFKTGKSKLLETICGQAMILYPIKLLASLHVPITAVVGFHRQLVAETISAHVPIQFVIQEEQRGTGHAVACTQHLWQEENILILNGDTPLVTQDILEQLYKTHLAANATISFITAHNPDHSEPYGRVVETNDTVRIVEAGEHATDTEHCCINAGIYIFKKEFLARFIEELLPNNTKHELYLTDLVHVASSQGLIVKTVQVPFDRIRGVNTLKELWAVEQIKRAELINYWMLQGVRFTIAQNVHIDLDVSIGAGTEIGSGVQLRRGTRISEQCTIGDFSIVEHSTLESGVTVYSHSVVTDSAVETGAQIGPFAHVRMGTFIGQHAAIGNFVEVKQSTVGTHTKAKHLTYLGDAHIGQRVNIGAGSITCNFDGTTKHVTTINDDAYIGSNNALVAPITIGSSAFTAAGSTITEDVPAQALAIARQRQVNREGYATKLRSGPTTLDTEQQAFYAAMKSEK